MKLRICLTACVIAIAAFALPGAALAQVSSPAPYVSEMRDACIAEMQKDAEIQVACMTQYSNQFHDDDAKQAVANKKFVVAAYAAIWGFLALLLAVMWLRQRKLAAEIGRLEAEIKKVAEE